MDLTALSAKLKGQAQASGTITLDASVLGNVMAPRVSTAFGLAPNAPLTISRLTAADIPLPAASALEITKGAVNFFGAPSGSVTVTFSQRQGGKFHALIIVKMTQGWTPNKSFPALKGFPFDQLDFDNAALIFSTKELAQNAVPAPLPQRHLPAGMSLVADADLTVLAPLRALVGSGLGTQMQLYGPFELAQGAQFPTGHLLTKLKHAPLNIGAGANLLTLTDLEAGVYLPPSSDSGGLIEPMLMVTGEVGAFRAQLLLDDDDDGRTTLTLSPAAPDTSLRTEIENLPGGSGFADMLPEPLNDIFETVGLGGFSMSVNADPSIEYIQLGIATVKPWELIPNVVVLEALSLDLELIMPGSAHAQTFVSLSAQAEVFPHVFPGRFSMSIDVVHDTSWRIETITGAYLGHVSLADLTRGLTGSAVGLPQALNDIQLGDLRLSVERSASGYQTRFDGAFEATLPVLDRECHAELHIAASQDADGKHALSLMGFMNLGAAAFNVSLDISGGQTVLVARWEQHDGPLNLHDLVAELGWRDVPELPDGLDPALTRAEAYFDSAAGTLVLIAQSLHYGELALASIKSKDASGTETRVYALALHIPAEADLGRIPVLADLHDAGGDVAIKDIKLTATSAPLGEVQAKALDKIVTDQLKDTPIFVGLFERARTGKTQAETKGKAKAKGSSLDLLVGAELFGLGLEMFVHHDGTGWLFDGRSLPGEGLTLDRVVTGLARDFHLPAPTSAIPKAKLTNFALRYVGAEGTLDVSAETSAEIEVPFVAHGHDKKKLHSKVSLSVKPEDGQPPDGHKVFSGEMKADLAIGPAVFKLSYAVGEELHSFEAEWISKDHAKFQSNNPAANAGHETFGLHHLMDLIGAEHAGFTTEMSAVVTQLALEIRRADLTYDPHNQALTVIGESAHYGDFFFVASKPVAGDPRVPSGSGNGWRFLFGFEYDGNASQITGLPGVAKPVGKIPFSVDRFGLLISNYSQTKVKLPEFKTAPVAQVGNAPAAKVGSGETIEVFAGISVMAVIGAQASALGEVLDGDLTFTLGYNSRDEALEMVAHFEGAVHIGKDFSLGDPWIKIEVGETTELAMGAEIDITIDRKVIEVPLRLVITPEALEANIEIKAEDEETHLPVPVLEGPFGIKGLMVDEMAFEMGVVFAPPGFNIGFEGGFHVGSAANEITGADQFALVLEIIEIIPNPQYFSFRLEELSIDEIVVLFTDHPVNLPDFLEEIMLTNLSFYWAEEQVTLPDGTVAQPGFAFSGNVDIADVFEAHMALGVNATRGISGEVALSPVHIGSVLSVTGKGPGVALLMQSYTPSGGVPAVRPRPAIPSLERNGFWRDDDNVWRDDGGHAWRRTKTEFKPPETGAPPTEAKTWQIVPPGGAVGKFNSAADPYLFVSLHVSLFETINAEVDAAITKDAFTFQVEIDVSDIAKAELDIKVSKEGMKAHAEFGLHVRGQLGPLEVKGVDLGEIDIDAGFDLTLDLEVTEEHFLLEIQGEFEFEGDRLDLPDFKIDVAPKSLSNLPELLLEHLGENAGEVFVELLEDAGEFLEIAAKEGAEIAVKGAEAAAKLADAAAHEVIDVAEAGATAVDKAADELEAEADAFDKKASATLANAERDVSKIDNDAERVVAEVGLKIAEVGEKAVVEIERIGAAIAHEAAHIAHVVAKIAEEALKIVEKIADEVDKVVHAILDEAKKIADAILDEAKKIVDAIEDEAKKIWDGIKQFAEKVGHALASAAKSAWHAISKY